MKTFQFNHNDMVTVTLTKEGAEFLSRKRKEFYDAYPQIKNRGKKSLTKLKYTGISSGAYLMIS